MSKAHHAAFIDVMPYDGTLAHAMMEMKTLDGADLPTASCASVIWAGTSEDKSVMHKNMFNDVREMIYKLSKDGTYAVPGLAGVPKELNTCGPLDLGETQFSASTGCSVVLGGPVGPSERSGQQKGASGLGRPLQCRMLATLQAHGQQWVKSGSVADTLAGSNGISAHLQT